VTNVTGGPRELSMPWPLCEAGGLRAAAALTEGRRKSVGGSGAVLVRVCEGGLGGAVCEVKVEVEVELRRCVVWCCDAPPEDFREWVGIAAGLRWHTRQG
jgi:hypothetical protein